MKTVNAVCLPDGERVHFSEWHDFAGAVAPNTEMWLDSTYLFPNATEVLIQAVSWSGDMKETHSAPLLLNVNRETKVCATLAAIQCGTPWQLQIPILIREDELWRVTCPATVLLYGVAKVPVA